MKIFACYMLVVLGNAIDPWWVGMVLMLGAFWLHDKWFKERE